MVYSRIKALIFILLLILPSFTEVSNQTKKISRGIEKRKKSIIVLTSIFLNSHNSMFSMKLKI